MVKTTLKMINTPRTWRIPRKKNVFITRPNPGSHNFESGMSVDTLLKNYFDLVDNTREVKYLINENKVFKNAKPIKSKKEIIGLFDVLSFPEIEKYYRITFDNSKKINVIEIKKEESNFLLMRLVDKKIIGKDKVQLNFEHGRNIVVDSKEAKKYTIKGSAILDLSTNKITKFVEFKEGIIAFVTSGNHIGNTVEVVSFEKEMATIKSNDKEEKAMKKFLVALGEKKAEITM
ncbi:MAG: hypothetical protein PHT94_02430 [Candidatus Nanoarchaeia archaeon]|nr:hypothetical protein [Candidatus Nanoarchaeia archaeon]